METYVESLTESLTQPQFSDQRFLEDVDYDDTVLEEVLHNAHRVHVYHYSRDFQDAESVRGGNSHVTSQPVPFPPHPDPGGMLSRSLGMPSRREGPPSIWDTHGISGNVISNPVASSSAPYPQVLNPSSSNFSEHTCDE